MKPDDKEFARQALESGRLTVEQVERLRAEAERTGRPLRELGSARVLNPWLLLLGGSAVIFAGLLVKSILDLRERGRREDDLALQGSKLRAEGDLRAIRAREDYAKKLDDRKAKEARDALGKARDAMAEGVRPGAVEPGNFYGLAARHYSIYLEAFKTDAEVFAERARARELLKDHERAIEDYERAVALNPDLGPALDQKLRILRTQAPRKP